MVGYRRQPRKQQAGMADRLAASYLPPGNACHDIRAHFPLLMVFCHKADIQTSVTTLLVGDPLYKPLGKTRRLALDQVEPSPAGGRFLFPQLLPREPGSAKAPRK
jgi:hypothetical protein